MNILSDHGEENVSPACRHGSDDAENIAAVHEGTDLYSNATACRVDDDVYNLNCLILDHVLNSILFLVK